MKKPDERERLVWINSYFRESREYNGRYLPYPYPGTFTLRTDKFVNREREGKAS